MEQWDVVCKRCGKYLFTEQRESTAGNIHRLNETNDEFYDEIKAEFYCTECAKNSDMILKMNNHFLTTKTSRQHTHKLAAFLHGSAFHHMRNRTFLKIIWRGICV